MNIFQNIKLFLIFILIIINIIFYFIFPENISKNIWHIIVKLCIMLMNIKTNIHGDKGKLNTNNLLIMCNHTDGLNDGSIIYNLYYNNNKENILYTIVKSNIVGDSNDNSILSNILSYIKTSILKSLHFISYTRGNKENGLVVKNIVADYIKNNKNILVFPEGTTRKNGIPKEFKHGIFQLAIEHNMNILPITIKYDKDIGTEREEPLNMSLIFNNNADVYIHDIIDCETDECYKNKDFLALKNKTFDIICSPFKNGDNKIKSEEIIDIDSKTTADLPKTTADLPVPA